MTHPLVRQVRERLRDAADPRKAAEMQRYMKSAMPFRGVSAPVQRGLWRDLFTAHPLPTFPEWRAVALELWRNAGYREERYAAIALTDLKPYAQYRTRRAIPMLEEMIVTGAWWDLVDPLATHHLGDVLRAEIRKGNGAAMRALITKWACGRDLWKRRAAILCQIRFKQETDLDLLYTCIEANCGGTDFFIRKAIGWALRQYAWVDAGEVRRYVTAHGDDLSGLSKREALRNTPWPAMNRRAAARRPVPNPSSRARRAS